MRSRGWATSALLVVALAASGARADCPAGPEEGRRAVVVHQGAEGVWFRLDVARCLLADVEELRLLRERVRLLDERLRLRDEQVELLRATVTLDDAIAERLAATADAALRLSARSERRSILRIVVGVAAAFLVGALGGVVAGLAAK